MRPNHEGDEAGRCGGCGSRDMITTRLCYSKFDGMDRHAAHLARASLRKCSVS